MKKIKFILIVLVQLLFLAHSRGQQNITSLSCDGNQLWGINEMGQIKQFSITGNTVSFDEIVTSNVPGYSLAICNNLNGGSVNPTFYTNDGSGDDIVYYNGTTNWVTIPTTPPHATNNAGGNGIFLYFEENNYEPPSYLMRYDGTSFTTIFTLTTLNFCAGDIAVDDDGNIWCFVGSGTPPVDCQFIYVISPSGQLIKQYNFTLNTMHAYGCFMLNNTLYLGLGDQNTLYPNKLLPITFTFDSAFIGTPLAMPSEYFSDLASCNSGTPLSVPTSEKTQDFVLYPNPAKNTIKLELYSLQNDRLDLLSVYDLQGKLLSRTSIQGQQTVVDISSYEAGLYIVTISGNKYIATKMIMKE